MLQTPKAGIQNHGQEREEMRSIYFSLESQTNLAQASRTPGNTIRIHSNKKVQFSSKLHQQKLHDTWTFVNQQSNKRKLSRETMSHPLLTITGR